MMKKRRKRKNISLALLLFMLLLFFYNALEKNNFISLTILKFSFALGLPLLGVMGYNLWNYLFQRREKKASKEKHKQIF